MKLRVSNGRLSSESGSVLATTMVITFLLGATLASFLMLTQHQTFANARSQSWNHTMAVSESGVEDALQMINRYSHNPELLLNWASDITSGKQPDNWVYLGNDTYRTARVIGRPARARYDIYVTNSNPAAPTIRAEGRLLYDYHYGKPRVLNLATVGTTSTELDATSTLQHSTTSSGFQTVALERTVVVRTRRDGLWTLGMLADREIDLNGNYITTDSFDSADPNASAWNSLGGYGTYDPTKRKENGDVATNHRIIDSINSGNATIIGSLITGPGGTVKTGPIGAVGSEEWIEDGNTGIEPGHSSDDMNVLLNDVALPTSTWFTGLPTFPGTGTNINGIRYKHVLTTSGDYRAATLQGSVYVGPGVHARLHLTDDVSLTGGEEIRIDPLAQRLIVYMEGESFKLAGKGVVNETGLAESFLYFGLPTNTQLVFQGNGDFTGAIYAPRADFTLGGGGSTVYDFIGASVSRTITMNGHYRFHYDEDLSNYGPSRGFIPTSWAEL